MDFVPGPRATAAGHRAVSFDRLGSTNSEALSRARAGEHGPLWIVAREQTAGRGRRGNQWLSGDGNLATSLLIHPDVPLATAATLGFVAGVALEEALAISAPGLGGRVKLKWPNDVTIGGAKLAGILLESEIGNDGVALVIGFGVNVATAPEGLPNPAVSLAALGAVLPAETLFKMLTDCWVDWANRWDQGRGMRDIRERWLARACGVGEPVSVRLGDRIVSGVFETLDEQGRLMVRDADSVLPVAAGDVHFGAAATALSEAP